jgi:hypothetical protein
VKIKNSSLSLKKKGVNILVKKTTRMEKKAKSLKLDLNRFFVAIFFFFHFFLVCVCIKKNFFFKMWFQKTFGEITGYSFWEGWWFAEEEKIVFCFHGKMALDLLNWEHISWTISCCCCFVVSQIGAKIYKMAGIH